MERAQRGSVGSSIEFTFVYSIDSTLWYKQVFVLPHWHDQLGGTEFPSAVDVGLQLIT